MLKKLFVLNLLIFGGSIFALAQTGGGVTKHVTLTKLKPCVLLTGAVQPKNFDTYIFSAKKGQIIIAEPHFYGKETNRPKDDEEGVSGFVFVDPAGQQTEDPQDVIFRAEKTGEHKILVRPAYRHTGAGKYLLKISVTDKEPKNAFAMTKVPKC